ncbi:MAG TPA: PEP-CTERM sorting domain-containing protein [Sedimentisphaerales bacterium]|nr:PEP-CTERM sorting domain-containing protein [Sedimentisphaerales bacterium]
MNCSKITFAAIAIIFSVAAYCQAGIIVNELPGGELSVFISPAMGLSCNEFNFDLVYDTSELIYNNKYSFFGTPCNSPMVTLTNNNPVNGVLTFTVSWLSEIREVDFLEIYFKVTNPVADGVSDFSFANATISNSSGSFFYQTIPAEGDDFFDVIPEPATILLVGLGSVILRKKK